MAQISVVKEVTAITSLILAGMVLFVIFVGVCLRHICVYSSPKKRHVPPEASRKDDLENSLVDESVETFSVSPYESYGAAVGPDDDSDETQKLRPISGDI